MSFDGFLSFGGIEIVNAQRTQAYIHNLMPGFPLSRHTNLYDTINVALEQEEYRTPFLDGADWVETGGVDEINPTHGFYGLYPLSIEGIGDSTMRAVTTEGILDGGFVNSERDGTRSIRVRGLLVGADILAVESGLTWLRNALRSNACAMHGDLCGYQDLRYFLARPQVSAACWGSDTEANTATTLLGALDPGSSPLIFTHSSDDAGHSTDHPMEHPIKLQWNLDPTDGVIVRWGTLPTTGSDPIEEYGPIYLQRSNFILNPTFATDATNWSVADGTVTQTVASDVTFGRFDQDDPVIYRTNWLPDPSFENGDPESNGWRSSGDFVATVDGTAPQGATVGVVDAAVTGVWIEASMLGPFDDDVTGTVSFWVRNDEDLTLTVKDNLNEEVFTHTFTGLADAWQRISVSDVPMKRDYVIRFATAGAEEMRVDGFLLEAVATMEDYFDGDTTDDAGADTYYYFVPAPDGPSREAIGVYDTFIAESAETDAPFGPAVLSFSMRSEEATPSVLVQLLDPDDTVIGSLTVNAVNDWTRYALGVDFGRRVRVVMTSSTGYFDLDDVMLEAGEQVNDYFDGSHAAPADYSLDWEGMPNGSISRMTWTGSTLIESQDAVRFFVAVDQGFLTSVSATAWWPDLIPMEQQLEPYDRTYHRVSCTVGVSRIRDWNISSGAATEVDFILTAATPHAFSTHSEAIPFDDAGAILYADEIVNLCTNPSGESATTGWTAIPGTTGVAAVTAPTVTTAFGTKVLRVTWSTASTAAGGGIYLNIPATEGYAYSISIGHVKSSINQRIRGVYRWYDIAAVAISATAFDSQAVTAGQIVSLDLSGVIAPANAVTLRVEVSSEAGTGYANWSIGSYLEVDGVMVNYGSAPAPYFDGSTTDTDAYDYSWDGATHLSTSRRALHVETLDPLIDPDLPVVPTAPRPPVVPDVAITEQNDWVRYYVEIPSTNVAVWAGTVPTLTLSTLTEDVRQVRVRFHPNPFGFDTDEIDPSNYCGEFLLSYLPSNSALTVSGVTQEAWAQVAGGAAQPANHLLYGTDGTPMDWPELSCGIAYVMTVDIPPTVDIANLEIDLVVNRRE